MRILFSPATDLERISCTLKHNATTTTTTTTSSLLLLLSSRASYCAHEGIQYIHAVRMPHLISAICTRTQVLAVEFLERLVPIVEADQLHMINIFFSHQGLRGGLRCGELIAEGAPARQVMVMMLCINVEPLIFIRTLFSLQLKTAEYFLSMRLLLCMPSSRCHAGCTQDPMPIHHHCYRKN